MTYYKYAEKRVANQMDWSLVGKGISDELTEVQRVRDEKRADIEKSSSEFLTTLRDAPQGEYTDANQYALDYASDGTEMMLMLNRDFKSGKINMREYTMKKQALLDGTNKMFGAMKGIQEYYTSTMQKYQAGEIGAEALFDASVVQGLAKFSTTKPVINPFNYSVGIAEKVLNPETGMMEISQDPSKLQTVNSLLGFIQTQAPKFDVNTSLKAGVEALGKEVQVLREGGVLTRSDITQREEYLGAETQYIESLLVNPHSAASVLTDFRKTNPNTGEVFEFTMDEKEAAANPNKILKVLDPQNPGSGRYVPKLSDEQTEIAKEALRTDLRKRLDLVETPTRDFAPRAGKTPPRPTEGQQKREVADRQTQEFVNNVGILYRGSRGNEPSIAEISDYIKTLPPIPSRGIVQEVRRTDDGIEVVYAKNPDKAEVIRFKNDDGTPVSYEQFVRNITTLFMGNRDFTNIDITPSGALAQGVDATAATKETVTNRSNAKYKISNIEVPINELIDKFKAPGGFTGRKAKTAESAKTLVSQIFNTLPPSFAEGMEVKVTTDNDVTLSVPSVGETFTFKIGTSDNEISALKDAIKVAYDAIEAKSKTKAKASTQQAAKKGVYKGVDANGNPIFE
jgi:hypothetical protein